MKLCRDCKHYRWMDECYAPALVEVDPINGVPDGHSARNMRCVSALVRSRSETLRAQAAVSVLALVSLMPDSFWEGFKFGVVAMGLGFGSAYAAFVLWMAGKRNKR